MINDVMTAERIGIKKKCGFWGINGNYFFDKFECLKYASSIKSYDIKFHYYDSVYKALDWSKEPTESLESLWCYSNQLKMYNFLIFLRAKLT
jgi:hypothetical protein